MDKEEFNEIATHRRSGIPETTKGPYYHKTWWESYKGAVKGILGGIVVGGMIGALAGGVVIGAVALVGGIGAISATGVGTIMAATTLFGMYEGKEKFEKVGITTGAVAAAQEISEVRMKKELREQFMELTNEVRELKAAVAGKIKAEELHVKAVGPDISPIFDESDYRSTHQTTDDEDGTTNRLMYWNVAGIGAAVGASVAAVIGLAAPGIVPHGILEFIGQSLGTTIEAGSAAATTATITTGAALGGSFGVSRDIFRKIFDVTDCWFMGVADGKCSNEEIAKAKGQEFEPLPAHQMRPIHFQSIRNLDTLEAQPLSEPAKPTSEISNVFIAEPQSSYFQERPSPEVTKMAILGMDHTTARMH